MCSASGLNGRRTSSREATSLAGTPLTRRVKMSGFLLHLGPDLSRSSRVRGEDTRAILQSIASLTHPKSPCRRRAVLRMVQDVNGHLATRTIGLALAPNLPSALIRQSRFLRRGMEWRSPCSQPPSAPGCLHLALTLHPYTPTLCWNPNSFSFRPCRTSTPAAAATQLVFLFSALDAILILYWTAVLPHPWYALPSILHPNPLDCRECNSNASGMDAQSV